MSPEEGDQSLTLRGVLFLELVQIPFVMLWEGSVYGTTETDGGGVVVLPREGKSVQGYQDGCTSE